MTMIVSTRSLAHRHPAVFLLAFLLAMVTMGAIVVLYVAAVHSGQRASRRVNTYTIPAGMGLDSGDFSPFILPVEAAPAAVAAEITATAAAVPVTSIPAESRSKWRNRFYWAAWMVAGGLIAAVISVVLTNPGLLKLM